MTGLSHGVMAKSGVLRKNKARPQERADDPLLSFAGKRQFGKEEEKLVNDLKKAGINGKVLKEKWDVVLWFVRDKGDKIRFLVDTKSKSFNLDAFQDWLQKALKPFRGEEPFEVKVKAHPVKRCCEKGCDGCLAGSKQHRKDWLP